MKREFRLPERYCPKHGLKMLPTRRREVYNNLTGAVEDLFQVYDCPKWFCFLTEEVSLVRAGQVLLP